MFYALFRRFRRGGVEIWNSEIEIGSVRFLRDEGTSKHKSSAERNNFYRPRLKEKSKRDVFKRQPDFQKTKSLGKKREEVSFSHLNCSVCAPLLPD